MRDTKPAQLAGLPGRHWLGLGLILVGVVGPFAVIILGLVNKWRVLVLVFVTPPLMLTVIRCGRSILAYSAHERLAHDKRPPVLFLRSFEEDKPSFATRFEQRLARALRDVGPFVAIGGPNEQVPSLGAARMYVQADADWHETVKGLLSVASLVIVHIGLTDGLLWEIEQVLSRVEPRRVVLSFGFAPTSQTSRRKRHEAFRLRTAHLFRRGLPDYDRKTLFLYFDSEGTPFSLRVGSQHVELSSPLVEQRQALESLRSELCGRDWLGFYRL